MPHHLLASLAAVAVTLTALAGGHLDRMAGRVVDLDEAAMRRWCDTAPLHGLEGVWYYPAEHVTMGIKRCEYATQYNECYIIVLLSADNDFVAVPGEVMGHLEHSVSHDKLALTLYSERDRVTLVRPVETVATLDGTGTELTFTRPQWHARVRFNLMRFLPSLFGGTLPGVSLTPEVERERLPIGFRKVYPTTRATTRKRYL